mgnify:FL=1
MAGHMGDAGITQQNLEIVATDVERGLLLIKGSVPGSKGGWLLISDAVKRSRPENAPYPAAVKTAVSADQAVTEAEAQEAPAESEE